MKFKVLRGTELFDRLQIVRKKMSEAKDAVKSLLDRLGYKQYVPNGWAIAGGIDGIVIQGTPPPNWKKVLTDQFDDVYLPMKGRKTTSDICLEISNLPKVDPEVINEILNYDARMSSKDNLISFHPGFNFKDDYVLLDFSDRCVGKYVHIDGMIEITASEYQSLYND